MRKVLPLILIGLMIHAKAQDDQLLSFIEAQQTKDIIARLESNLANKEYSADEKGEFCMTVGEYFELRRYSYDSALMYYADARDFFSASQNTEGLARSYNYSGICYLSMQNGDGAISMFHKAIAHYSSRGEARRVNLIMNNIGLVYTNMGILDSAKTYLINLLLRYDSLPKDGNYINAQNNLGIVYQNEGDYRQAIKTYQQVIDQFDLSGDTLVLAKVQNNIAGSFHALEEYDSSLFYLTSAIDNYEYMGHLQALNQGYGNLSALYSEMGQSIEARRVGLKSINVAKEVKDRVTLTTAYVNVAETFEDKRAYLYFDSAIAVAEEYDLLPNLSTSLMALSNYAFEHNDLGKAYRALKQQTVVDDSLKTARRNEIISDLEVKYDTQKKDQQLTLQSKEIEVQKTRNRLQSAIIGGLVVFLFLVLVIGYLIRRSARRKQAMIQAQSELELKDTALKSSIESTETERKRFAKDLHDNFGQLISIMNMSVNKLSDEQVLDAKGRQDTLTVCQDTLSDMYAEVKNVCFDLMPKSLEVGGLIVAIREFILRINKLGGVKIELIVVGDDVYPSNEVAVSQYRIVQEWVNNVMKYSDAENITIQVIQDEDEILLMIEDDGMGFDSAQLENSTGYGWKNIQTRTDFIQGELDLDTVKGRRGNTLSVTIQKMSVSAVARKSESTAVG